jgi:hypothetical protein
MCRSVHLWVAEQDIAFDVTWTKYAFSVCIESRHPCSSRFSWKSVRIVDSVLNQECWLPWNFLFAYLYFFDKEYILISRRYQLQRSALVAIRMHTAKKRRRITKKISLCRSSTNITKIAPEIWLLHKRRLQEGNSAQAPSSPHTRS